MLELGNLLSNKETFIVTLDGCPYCSSALEKLDNERIKYKHVRSEEEPKIVQEIKTLEKHRTFPMIYLDGDFIGGCDDLCDYFKARKSSNAL